MDKITHQVRAEHWAKIMNECINSGMTKTAWCRANGISEKQFFYWQRILRREAFDSSQDPSLPAASGRGRRRRLWLREQPLLLRSGVDCQVKLPHFFVESCPTLVADKAEY